MDNGFYLSKDEKLRLILLTIISIGLNSHNKEKIIGYLDNKDQQVVNSLDRFGVQVGSKMLGTGFKMDNKTRKNIKSKLANVSYDLLRYE